jgi:hypothetical protein
MVSTYEVECFARRFAKKTRGHHDELLIYAIFTVFAIAGLEILTDKIFSALITIASAFHCLGFILLRRKVAKQGDVNGISSRTLMAYVLCYVCRLYSTLQFNGYLPIDRSGDWLYQTVDIVALLIVLNLLSTMFTTHYYSWKDSVVPVDTFPLGLFVVACFVLALFIHPGLNNLFHADVSWTAGLYVEAIAMIPQLFMMTKQGGEVDAFASHFIACIFVSRFLMILFWLASYEELKPHDSAFNFPGWGLMGAQFLQIAIFGDFMYIYVKSIRTSSRLVLPDKIICL